MSYDITLDNQGYMLVPGSYRATHATERATQRQRMMTDLLHGVGAWPSAGHGVGPGQGGQAVTGTVSSSEPKLTASDGDYLYIAAGSTLYRWNRAVGTAPVSRTALPADARCMVRLNDELFIGYGSGADVSRYDDATNTLTASALGAGVEATLLATFSRGIVLVAPGSLANLHLYYGNSFTYSRTWRLDGRILNACQLGDRMVIATDAGLHLLTGSWYQDTDPPAPPETLRLTSWGTLSGQLQDNDDFAWMIVFGGRLLAWLGKRVVVFDEWRGWWEPAGLEGTGTDGVAVVNGWLLTTIAPRGGSTERQLWGYNGERWWLLEEIASGGANWLDVPTADGAGKLITFQAGGTTLRAYDLDSTATSTRISPFSIATDLLDGGEPDREKRWLRVGVELDRTDGVSVGSWSFAVEYSTDGGTSWTSAGAATVVTGELASIEHDITATSHALMLRVAGTRTSGQPPFITTLWCEYDSAEAQRRWQFSILARTKGTDRDGALDPRTGQTIRTALWSLWEMGESIPFRDIDYSVTTLERTVRLTAIRESWPKPADQAVLGADTVMEVTVVGE